MHTYYFLCFFLLIGYMDYVKGEENSIPITVPETISQKIVEKNRKRLRAQAHQIEHFIVLFEQIHMFFENDNVTAKVQYHEFKNKREHLLQFLQDMLYLTRSKKVHLKTITKDLQILFSQLTAVSNLIEQINISLIEKKDIDAIFTRVLDLMQSLYLLYMKKTVHKIYEMEIECLKMDIHKIENQPDPTIIKRKSAVMLTHYKLKTGYNNPMVYISFDELWQQVMNEIYSTFDEECKIGEIIVFCAPAVETRDNLELIEKSDYFILSPTHKAFIALATLYPCLETAQA